MGFIAGMKSLGNKLKPIAPTLGRLALNAVPGGSVAAQVLDAVRGATGSASNDPEELANAVAQADPAQAAAIRAADQQFELEMFRAAAQHDQAIAATQGKVVRAEAKGESWLQRNWRPVTMLTFVALVVSYFYGFTAQNIDAPIVEQLLTIVQYGLTGYVAGRSGEKIAKQMFPDGWKR